MNKIKHVPNVAKLYGTLYARLASNGVAKAYHPEIKWQIVFNIITMIIPTGSSSFLTLINGIKPINPTIASGTK